MIKDFERQLIEPEKTEVNVKKQQQVEYVLNGTITPKRGHIIWELNEKTGKISPAKYKKNTIGFVDDLRQPDKLIILPDCVYIPALNKENAKRKYLKNKDQRFYYDAPAPMNLKDITA